MRIAVLAENTACREGVTAQHGLSLYIETNNRRILFDMGQDDTFLRNADALEIDLSKVDLAFVSHGHYDHGGGLAEFLKINAHAPVYIHEAAFGAYYNGTEKYIGLDTSLSGDHRLIFTKGKTQLLPGIMLADCNELGWRSNSWGLTHRQGDTFFPDPFIHEQYLQIVEGEKCVLISGCSHKGILNIAGYFHPDVLIGGFHLNKLEDTVELERIAKQLLSCSTICYTGHCTGEKQYSGLKEKMDSRLHRLSTGLVFEL